MTEPAASPADARPGLRDPGRQREFEERGYVVVPLFPPDEVAALREGYQRLVPDPDAEIIAFDYTRDDRSVMEGVRDLLKPAFAPHVDRLFTDHEAVFWTFVIKPSGPHGELDLHDDRTYVDDRTVRPCTVWVPLVDTGPSLDNGYLCVVPGSHTILDVASGTNIPAWWGPYRDYLRAHSVGVEVPAGHALVYDSKTLHWSPPNRSPEPRPAIAAAVVPRGHQVVHVVGEGMHYRRVYGVDEKFYVDFHPLLVENGMPEGYPLLREYDEPEVSASPERVAAAIGADDLPVPVGEVEVPTPRAYEPAPAAAPDDPADPTAGSPEPGGAPARRRWWTRRPRR